MNPRLTTLLEQVESHRAVVKEIDAVPAEDVTDEQVASYRAALDALDVLIPEVEAEQAYEAKRAKALAFVAPQSRAFGSPDLVVNNDLDPFADMQSIRAGLLSPTDLRSRALKAIEASPEEHFTDAQRERVTRLTEVGDPGGRSPAKMGRHILMTGSRSYHEEFEDYVRTGYVGESLRAAMSLTDGNGGYLVPFTLDPTVILTNAGTINPYRQVCDVKTITTDVWHGVSSAGVTAAFAAEAAEAGDNSPTFSGPSITPLRAHAWVQGSFEVINDANMGPEIARLFADAKDRLEAAKFTTGATGSTEPNGVITALVAGSKITTSITTDTFAIADVFALKNAVTARHRTRLVWLGNPAILDKVRQFDTGGGGGFWTDLGASLPSQLIGRPVYEVEDMDGVIGAGADNYVLVAFNPATYSIVDRVGMSVLYDPLVKGSNRRPTGEAGWYCFWRVGADFTDVTGGRVLNVT